MSNTYLTEELQEALTKSENESVQDYLQRVYYLKLVNNVCTWEELTPILNEQLGEHKDESTYRRQAKRWNKKMVDEYTEKDVTEKSISDLILEYKKERYKLQEERTQNNSYIRRLSREETLKEIAENAANTISSKKLLYINNKDPYKYSLKPNAAILMISDWHYGLETDNFFNFYNPEVCKERVSTLREDVISYCKFHSVKKLIVANLGDLISGRIHYTLRLESREDCISQIIEVSEMVAELLSDLSNEGFDIDYFDVLDNHSRLEPNKKESMNLESLARIVPWYLKQRLKDFKNITINSNTYADDIMSFKLFDFTIAGVHGHKDKPDQIINNLCNMTRHRNDLVLSAHLHHFHCDESHETMRVSNGSLMGVDSHTQDLRLSNKASQTLIIVTPDNVTHAIYKINLN